MNNNFTDEMAKYFDSLPENVKETIRLSAEDITDLAELTAMAENLKNN